MALTKTPLEKGFEKLYRPFQAFIQSQTTASLLLLICVLIALVIANSPWTTAYLALIDTPIGFVLGEQIFAMSLKHWVNDGLMTYFFFLLGLEIKREILVGDINSLNTFLPIAAAALGGMLIPALLYLSLTFGTEVSMGWGIPMATDTALAVGILALLGRHIPAAAFIFLTALAIIDDIGAILVIALFYSDAISLPYLAACAVLLLTLLLFNLLGIRKPGLYLTVGAGLWAAMLGSGIHATVAGVLVAVTVPARPKQEPIWFIHRLRNLLFRFEHMEKERADDTPILGEPSQHTVALHIHQAAEQATTPLRRWEQVLQQPVALFILPVFALTNAGIPIQTDLLVGIFSHPLALGIIAGLVLGKTLGISLFCWLALRLQLGQLPGTMTFRHVVGLSFLGGIGFTMSIFISELGFSDQHEALVLAKTAIIIASLIAGVGGYLWFRFRT
ncbi:Na+/H+ antiporter NhaA [Photobacterium sp. TY1-4]|uniref:Na+/H+ antiporter NhaA n=1 Tax=Photobacterium sp. TY1-4 TaxID=2899122 RepID=UPI0021C018D3|nr:Na+/H+ antiporter NhaA [Photobacterium sp. TY1-4]UXI03641.1 Na+/H+ antiporter NhaA [Photobacterium sp. TY1-4]